MFFILLINLQAAVSYPWNTWKAGIHQLRHLKTLYVDTVSPPVVGMRPGELPAELALIGMWDRGMGYLTEVNLGYGCEGLSYRSKWVKVQGSGAWARQEHWQNLF